VANFAAAPKRVPGLGQGATIIAAGFLPTLAIFILLAAVPSIIDHFAADSNAGWKVPGLVSAPSFAMAPFAVILVDRFGRGKLLLLPTFYALIGAALFFRQHGMMERLIAQTEAR
jgi:MFS family permease